MKPRSSTTQTVFAQLEALMQLKGVSRADLARRMGVSRTYISRLFRHQQTLTLDVLFRMCDVLGLDVSITYLPRESETCRSSSDSTTPSPASSSDPSA